MCVRHSFPHCMKQVTYRCFIRYCHYTSYLPSSITSSSVIAASAESPSQSLLPHPPLHCSTSQNPPSPSLRYEHCPSPRLNPQNVTSQYHYDYPQLQRLLQAQYPDPPQLSLMRCSSIPLDARTPQYRTKTVSRRVFPQRSVPVHAVSLVVSLPYQFPRP